MKTSAAVERRFKQYFNCDPQVLSFAPGRIEVLGNHTDYNQGLVLAAAIDKGIYCAATLRQDNLCRIYAGDLEAEISFKLEDAGNVTGHCWSNYVRGMIIGLQAENSSKFEYGFNAFLAGNIPAGSGLSSSAAMEMSTGIALANLYKIKNLDLLHLAKIGQATEHHYVGVKCGLLDQLTSLYGQAGKLVEIDFRQLSIKHVPCGSEVAFLVCNTHAKHALVDGEYNERRNACEQATAFFQQVLSKPVSALRDVTWEEWEHHQMRMDPVIAKRAAHPIGENMRVQQGARLLSKGDLIGFGKLMYASHDSSRLFFENSCIELDAVVAAARQQPGVYGARLSGGGFGGSVVILAQQNALPAIAGKIAKTYFDRFGIECSIYTVAPDKGARLLYP